MIQRKIIFSFILLICQFSIAQNTIKNKLSLKTEKSDCKVVNIEKVDNYNLITVDFVIIKALEDDEDGHDNAIVINNNPKLRTYILPNKLLNTHKETLDTCDICFWNIKVSEGIVDEITWFVFQ